LVASHAQVCKAFATVVRGELLWKQLCSSVWHSVPTDVDMKTNALLPVRHRTQHDVIGSPFVMSWREYYWTRGSYQRFLTHVASKLPQEAEKPAKKKFPRSKKKATKATPPPLPTTSEIAGTMPGVLYTTSVTIQTLLETEQVRSFGLPSRPVPFRSSRSFAFSAALERSV